MVTNLAESSKDGCDPKRTVLPMMVVVLNQVLTITAIVSVAPIGGQI
jgi:hypothetical protein